ncbi:MAG TPA: hypothetical protein VGQ57_08635 [Polyangiaceae bacterium]|jgi:hypothetical protein|nr:hypothetical protein [Polyangiaceae bacterium]
MRLLASPFSSALLAAAVACSAGGSGTKNLDPDLNGSGGTSGKSSTGNGGTGNTTVNPNNGGTIAVGATGGTLSMDDPDVRMAACASGCSDLAGGPVLDTGVPANAESMFSGSPSGTGPCILEPGDNTLVPYNWLRPRVHIGGHKAGTVYQIKVSTARESDVLTAYTNKDTWILPQEFWDNGDADNPKGLTRNVFDEDITVTVRASGGGESSVKFRIAPVKAGGSMVFWSAITTEPGANTNALYGFAPGDEGIVVALEPLDVLETILNDNGAKGKDAITDAQVGAVPEGRVRCVGCHTSTPDGAAVNITDHWPWNVRLVNLSGDSKGKAPDYVTPMGDLLMQMPWQGVTSYSKGDWALGKHRYVTSFAKRPDTAESQPWTFWAVDCGGHECPYGGKDDLIWLDVSAPGTAPTDDNDNARPKAALAAQGTGWDIIPRTGDPNGAVLPDWSHDGQHIVYTSTDSTADGHVGLQPNKNEAAPTAVDLYTVPFNAGMGGTAAPVMGASNAADAEYYPDYSADDALIAFTRVSNFKQIFSAASSDDGRKIYYRPEAEVAVVRASGGDAISLEANAPPACSGETSPGVYNSWPKWSPIVREAGGKKYYFLIFSSARESLGKVKDKSGNDTSSPMSQLYMTALVDEGGTLSSYGASYLWNQRYLVTPNAANPANPTIADFVQNNVTPAWDEFQAPPVPPIKVTVR